MTPLKKLCYVSAFLLTSFKALSQEVAVIKFDELDKMLNTTQENNTVYNFWATWCGPCVKELPQFEALNQKYADENLEVVLISMDFVESKTKVEKFITKKGIKSKVYLLDETDHNAFIDKIDPSWSGAIPATIFVNGGSSKKTFYEKEFKEGELEKTYIETIN